MCHLTEYGIEGLVEFKWKNLEDGRHVRQSEHSFLNSNVYNFDCFQFGKT
jgi:hypothetical protein